MKIRETCTGESSLGTGLYRQIPRRTRKSSKMIIFYNTTIYPYVPKNLPFILNLETGSNLRNRLQ